MLRTLVNFINILRTNFLYECRFGSFFYVHVTREKLPKRCSYEKFACKINVDEIDTFSPRFFNAKSGFVQTEKSNLSESFHACNETTQIQDRAESSKVLQGMARF